MFKGNFSYKELYKEKYKWKNITLDPLIDLRKREAIFSLIITAIIMIIIGFMDLENNIEILNNEIKDLILYIATALIGVLGFILSGIAIISGTFNNKLLKEIDNGGKYDDVILLLMGFWYIAKRIALVIVVYFIAYIIVISPFSFVKWIFYPFGIISTYLAIFVIMYITSLFETCIKIMNISFKYSDKHECSQDNNENKSLNDNIKVNGILINALVEKMLGDQLSCAELAKLVEEYTSDMTDEEDYNRVILLIKERFPNLLS